MLEGLEINIINYLELFSNEDDTFRFDSEHYQKHYRQIINKIKEKEYKKLSEILKTPVITGHTPSMKVDRFYGGSVKFIKTDNLRENRISGEFNHTLTEEGNNEILRSSLGEGDIITTIIGATLEVVGRTSIIQKEILPANINQNIALIRVDKNLINPHYLNIYLNTKYGRNLLYWQSRQTGQVNLNCREVERIYVPIFKSLEITIESIVNKIESLKLEVSAKYEQAENLLLNTLDLKKFQPSKELVNVKSFSESFRSSGRLDAEYYQAKYDDLEAAIRANSDYRIIGNIRTVNSRGLQPEYFENGEIDVINSKHILENTLDYENFEKTNSSFWESQKKARVFKDDILTYTTGANIGRTQVYLSNDKALASNHVNILRLHETYNPLYVGFVMNSIVGRMQTEKFSAGSAQAELYPKDIDQFMIPFCSNENQKSIISQIEEGFKLEKQSELLLQTAKTAIEMAIEKDEDKAISFIKELLS